MPKQTTLSSIEEAQATRSQEFMTSCNRVLTGIHLSIEVEIQKRAPFLPMPDNFLFGSQSVESDLYPSIRELEVMLAQPPSDERSLRVDQLLDTILRLSVYHQALHTTNVRIVPPASNSAGLTSIQEEATTTIPKLEQLAQGTNTTEPTFTAR